MNVKPLEAVLIREIQSEEAESLNFLAEAIEQIINIGTHFIKWETDRGDVPVETTPLIMMHRHILEMGDAVSILISSSSIDPCKALLRSIWETSLQIEYLLKDPEKMGFCYITCHHNKMIKLHKRFIKNSFEQKEYINQLKGKSFIDIDIKNLSDPNAENEVKGFEKLLEDEYFKIYQKEYLRTLQKNKNPEWYSLFDGPKTCLELAAELKKKDMYEFLYRFFSSTVHGSDLLNSNLRILPNGYAEASYIRNNEHVSETASMAIQLLLYI